MSGMQGDVSLMPNNKPRVDYRERLEKLVSVCRAGGKADKDVVLQYRGWEWNQLWPRGKPRATHEQPEEAESIAA